LITCSAKRVEQLKHFVEMQGFYYPDLVRVFYNNYKFRDGVAFTKVKVVDLS